jgi:outer membrane protein OmpA-like peptidoglycan-associated protein
MAFNLIDSARSIFGNDFISKASAITGENAGSLQTALSAIIPTVLTGLLHQAGTVNPQSILLTTRDAAQSGILNNLPASLSSSSLLSKGTEMFKSLFGDKAANVTGLISNFSGIRESSAGSLVAVAAPAVLGIMGRHATETHMSAGGMLGFLNNQKDSILNALPQGLNLAGAMGLGSLTGISSKLSGKLSEWSSAPGSEAEKLVHSLPDKKKVNWLAVVLGAVIVLAIIILIGKGCNGSDKPNAVLASDSTKLDTVASPPLMPSRESVKVKLPDGTELNAYKGGIEDQLVIFLNNPASVPGKNVWFDFDNLNFTTGSAQITEESMVQVKNISAILKAYPKLKIKIGGYTDNTGDSLSNITLSKNRAMAVLNALESAGADSKQILGADGYGSQFAKAGASASDEEKQKDRRISVSVRAK